VVTTEGFTITATTDAVIAAKAAERNSRPWVPLPVVDETRLLSFDEVCTTLTGCTSASDRIGGKATGLSLLANRQAAGRADQAGSQSARFGHDLSPRGFAIPVKGYRDFVNAPGNAVLKQKIAAFIALEKAGTLSPAQKNTLILEIQGLFYKGRIDPTALAAVNARLAQLLPGVPSSSSARAPRRRTSRTSTGRASTTASPPSSTRSTTPTSRVC
jgi:hypothetical protein